MTGQCIRRILTVAACIALSAVDAAHAEIRCDRFNVQAERKGDQITVSLDTDCPDFAQIIVDVWRGYREAGSGSEYLISYLQEKSTVGAWRKPHQINVANSRWIEMLEAHRKKMSRLGMGFTVSRINDDIEVDMVLPINQRDPRFGKRNENLIGNAVKTGRLRIAESEKKIHYPLADKSVGRARLPSTDPNALDVGQSYRLDKETPLMPERHPHDPMAALNKMRSIPKGYVVKVVSVSRTHGTPWYQVVVRDPRRGRVGAGWVNSVALFGQNLRPVP